MNLPRSVSVPEPNFGAAFEQYINEGMDRRFVYGPPLDIGPNVMS